MAETGLKTASKNSTRKWETNKQTKKGRARGKSIPIGVLVLFYCSVAIQILSRNAGSATPHNSLLLSGLKDLIPHRLTISGSETANPQGRGLIRQYSLCVSAIVFAHLRARGNVHSVPLLEHKHMSSSQAAKMKIDRTLIGMK